MTSARSTFVRVRNDGDHPAPQWGRRLGTAVLFLVVLAGALGVFGVHSATTRTSSSGYQLTVIYARTARAGLDVPFRVKVHRDAGFSGDLTIAISLDYFRMFETQGFFPDPDSASNDGTFYGMTYNKPAGTNFELDYDAYIQPSSQIGKSATIKIIVGGQTVASTSIHTWLAP
jgi:hypothetical protein